MQKTLKHTIELEVKFSEVDSLGIVWHGHYIQYFEDGREAFGKQHGLSYLSFFDHGFVTPLVNIHCDFKRSLKYGDIVIVETDYVLCESAKLKFNYKLFNAATGQVVAVGYSVQVFLDAKENLLQLTNPPFFQDWKDKQNFS